MSNLIYQFKVPTGQFQVYSEIPDLDILYLKQVHGNKILNTSKLDSNGKDEADGMTSKLPIKKKPIMAIKTADCLPILIIGNKGVSFLHAGWKGLKEKIILQEENFDIEPYFAFIGPSIHKENFEVTKEFYDHFPHSHFFEKSDGKIRFNLQQEAISQLIDLNSQMEITDSGICTFADKNFHSFRRDKNDSRNWNVFIPSP